MRMIAALATLLAAASQQASAQSAAAPAEQRTPVDTTGQASDVRTHSDDYDRLTVGVKIAGQGPYRFLVDTGANRTAISGALAAQLGLAGAPGVTLYTVTGSASVRTARVPMLDWTGQEVPGIEAALLEPANMGADGILGLDSLRSQRIVFDFDRNSLTVSPSALHVRDEPNAIVITGRARNGRLILTNAEIGNSTATLVVDTGAQFSVGNSALRARLSRGGMLSRGGTVELQSVTGEKLTGEYAVVRQIDIGGVTLHDLPIVFADSAIFAELRLEKEPAMLLGMNALRGFRKVSIDVAQRKLKVVLPERSSLDRQAFASL